MGNLGNKILFIEECIMYKFRKITFKNHPVLNNLSLDFCDETGKAVDTIILAGENGTGKSTILNELYKIAVHGVNHEQTIEIEKDGKIHKIVYEFKIASNGNVMLYANDGEGMKAHIGSLDLKNKYPFRGIFSDVDINFKAQQVSSVTSLTLDAADSSRRSTNDLPTQIKQLLIDIQDLDDAEVATTVRKNPEKSFSDITINERMPRFTKSFNQMFSELKYSHIENTNNSKSIIFMKNSNKIPIDSLSSGEKQIVYRGCFLLRDVNATEGAFIFIDEPEISLHPIWQMKIMDYYKGIFTDKLGKQTSQIFVVTHSPFVIHSENRHNDKVIVLTRDSKGEIVVKDKPEYYKCASSEIIRDAFFIPGFSEEKSMVYLEGRTDEKYFNKALEVFGYQVPFSFSWIGYMGNGGQEENTGKDALNKAVQFLRGRNLNVKTVCLFDCDTQRKEEEKNNVYTRVLPTYINSKNMKKGIENALILDDIDVTPFYKSKIKEGDYGDDSTIVEFKKMEFCDAICDMDAEVLKRVLANLKDTIDMLQNLLR